MKELALEGIDGSGKSSVATSLTELLQEEGLHVAVYSPLRIAKDILGIDPYELWNHETLGIVAVQQLLATTDHCRETATNNGVDMIIYDRHWMTGFVEFDDNPDLIEVWGDNFIETAVLKTSPITARLRCQNDLDAPWMTDKELKRYFNKYEDLTSKYNNHILGVYRSENDVTPNSIANNIAWDLRVKR